MEDIPHIPECDMSRITQKNIALKLGISPSLVSRALSGKAGSIGGSIETTNLIIKTAKDLGYVPSAAARRMRGEGGPVIGVVIADIGDPFFAQAMSELIRQTHQRGYALAVAGFDRRVIDQRELSLLLEQDLSGLLIIGGGPIEWLGSHAGRHMTMVRIGSVQQATDIHQIGPDEAVGFLNLIRHLKSYGHQRIGFVGADHEVHRERLKLAQSLARKDGMICKRKHVAVGSDHVLKAGLDGGRKLIEQSGNDLPTAIICSSDTVAMGVMNVLVDRGIRIPGDISVTGFDDIMLSQLTSPPLTTLHQPLPDMIELALNTIISGKHMTAIAKLPLKLISRASTGSVTNHQSLPHRSSLRNRQPVHRTQTSVPAPRQVIVMGVSGCGKSSVGKKLAEKLGWKFVEGDDYHPASNVKKMSSGIPLNDDDRWPWLEVLREILTSAESRGESVVLSCSALRQVYRERLIHGLSNAHFIYLKGNRTTLLRNMKNRTGHFMKPGMLDSQLKTLEEPKNALTISCDLSVDEIVEIARKNIHE